MSSSVALIATSAWLISSAALAPALITLSAAITGVRAFAIARAVTRYLERLTSHDVAFRVLARVRAQIFQRLEPLAPARLEEFRRGDLLARLVSDVESLQDLSLRVLHPLVVAAGAVTVSVSIIAPLAPSASAVLLAAWLVAAIAVPAVTALVGRRAEIRIAPARAELSATVAEVLRAAPDLRAFGAASVQLTRINKIDAELAGIGRRTTLAVGLGAGLVTWCAGVAVAGGLVAGASAMRSGALAGVGLAVVVLVPLAAFESVAPVHAAILALSRARASGERVLEVLDSTPPVREPAIAQPLPPAPRSLRLRGVHARWPGSAPALPAALCGVDLDLAPGQRVAVVGESGSGKTTLAAVLLRFVDLEAGSYRIGEVDARAVLSDELREVIGLCGHDAHIFDSTLRENLQLARPSADDVTLCQALAEVRLLDWADELPHGLDTELGERGTSISAGQRQRIALARALLADFDMLVLDEPTAHLDPETAEALTRDLLDATAGRATLLITHRLSGLEVVDQILLLHGGGVAERGTHGELLALDGRYAALWRREQYAASGRRRAG
jgi:thiol reductant ABC exporter CydC subunit